jgi:DNA-binding transcriptional MocR family regulator
MEKYIISLNKEETPKYLQLARHIKRLIETGEIEDGEKLLPIRNLSDLLGVNSVTVINAYKRLQVEGYAVLKIGSGTYAKKKEMIKNIKKEYSETVKKITPDILKNYIDFTGETTSSTFFPVEIFKNILNEVLDRDGTEALIYQDVLGYSGLRKSISKFFWNGRLEPDNLLVVSGAQQGIDIVSKAMINVNDNIILEKPTYSGALSVFNWRRANIYEVEVHSDGVNVEEVETIVKKNKIKCFYTMSYFQNPTGATYSMEKKLRLLQLAEKYDFYIIEDDYLSELIYDEAIEYKSFKSLDSNDRVIYIKSFSKIFLPGIRLGYLIHPAIFKESIQNSKVNTDIATSSLMQRALDLYINNGYWKEHIKFLNIEYKKRYIAMNQCLINQLKDKISFTEPGGGLNFFIRINDSIPVNSRELFWKCKDLNILVTPGSIFYRRLEEGDKHFRLGFSQTDEGAIEKGIGIINNILSGK